MKKRFLSSVVSLVLLLGLSPVNASVVEKEGELLKLNILTSESIDLNEVDKQKKQFEESKQRNNVKYSIVQNKQRYIPNNEVIAVNINELNENIELKNTVQTAYKNGNKIYFYGDVELDNIKNILEIESLKVNAVLNDTKSTNSESIKVEVESLINNETENKVEEKGNSTNKQYNAVEDIVGYSIDGELNIVDIQGLEEVTNEILVANIIDKELEKNTISSYGVSAVTSSTSDTTITSYAPNGNLRGRTSLRWVLYRDTSESDSRYDYFAFKPLVFSSSFNGNKVDQQRVMLQVPYNGDYTYDFGPKSTQSGNYTASINLITGQITAGGSLGAFKTIRCYENLSIDKAEWYINSPNSAETSMSWRSDASSAKLAAIDWQMSGYFSRSSTDFGSVQSNRYRISYYY